jgi:O-antigen ligase
MTFVLPRQAEPDGSAMPSPWRADGAIVGLLTAAWTAAGIVLWLIFPMTAPVLLALCVVAPLAWHWRAEQRLPWHAPSPVIAALAVAGGYLLVNASWSLSPAAAAMAIALILVTVAVLHVVPRILTGMEAAPLRAMAAGTIAGLAVGGTLLSFEIFSEQALRRLLIGLVPALQPNPLHVAVEGGQVIRLMPYLPNASVGVLALLFWPALLIAGGLGLLRRHRWGVLAAAAAVAATVLASEHATSKAALAGSAAAFALFLARPRLARWLVGAGWMAMILLVVPIASLLYGAEGHHAGWLPDSARHRIVIWGYTSGEVAKAPLFGVGIGTARALHEARDPQAPSVPGTRFQLGTGLHSHNAYLQVWYETGAVGALILLGLGLLVLRTIAAFTEAVQPWLAATFVAGALLVASSYSIWAPWLMASLAMACVFAALGAALSLREADPGRERNGVGAIRAGV